MSYRSSFSAPPERRSRSILMFLIFINLLGWILSGCSLVPVGGAEKLPEVQRARIYFYSDKGINTSDWKVDEVERGYFALGHQVAPGRHSFRNSVQTSDKQCVGISVGSRYGGYGSSGYANSSAGPCFETRYQGSCSGTVDTNEGKSYSIRASGSPESIYLTVTDESDGSTAGYGSCNMARN